MKKLIIAALLPMSAIAWAADSTTTVQKTTTTADTSTSAGAPGTTTTTASNNTNNKVNIDASKPGALCKGLVEAAKNGDFNAIRDHMTGPHMDVAQMKKGFNQMESHYMDHIKSLSCGHETIAGEHAVVEADSKGEKRLIPFILQGGSWKFDNHVYMSMYPMHGMHQHAGQASKDNHKK